MKYFIGIILSVGGIEHNGRSYKKLGIKNDKLSIKHKIMLENENTNEPQKPQFIVGAVISRFFFNERMWLKIGRDKAEPEKSVLPTILFINTNHQSFTDLRHRGFMLCVGWWDFSIKLGLFF